MVGNGIRREENWEEEWTVGKRRKVPKQKADDSRCVRIVQVYFFN